jgi:NDP-sugar pyrophosphorylase family protein
MQILIPMAGKGRRFAEAGYKLPKPFIDVDGEPMIRRVLTNLPLSTPTTLNILEEHRELAWGVAETLPGSFKMVEGANPLGTAASILDMAHEFDQDEPLLIANSDQLMDWSPDHFVDFVERDGCDGAIVTFRASGPKWSYAKCDDDMVVQQVAEKDPISQDATVGVYYFRRAGFCFEAIERMIVANRSVNGEFYTCPCYNELLIDGRRIIAYPVPRMFGMGTPADLKATLEARPWAVPAASLHRNAGERHD